MSELAWRLILVGGAAALAFVVALASRLPARLRARRAEAAPLDLSDFDDPVVLFTTAPCISCDVARERLTAAGTGFREIAYGDDPEAHRTAGVEAVPLIVVRGPDGREAGRIAGRPSKRALQRLLGRVGAK